MQNLHPALALEVAKRHRADEIRAAERHRLAREVRHARGGRPHPPLTLAGLTGLAAVVVGVFLVLPGPTSQLPPPQDTTHPSTPA